MSYLGKHGQDGVHVVYVRRSSLGPHQLQHLPLGPTPGCSHRAASTEQVLEYMKTIKEN